VQAAQLKDKRGARIARSMKAVAATLANPDDIGTLTYIGESDDPPTRAVQHRGGPAKQGASGAYELFSAEQLLDGVEVKTVLLCATTTVEVGRHRGREGAAAARERRRAYVHRASIREREGGFARVRRSYWQSHLPPLFADMISRVQERKMIEALLVDRLPAVMNRGPGGYWACAWSLSSLSCVCLGAVSNLPCRRRRRGVASRAVRGARK